GTMISRDADSILFVFVFMVMFKLRKVGHYGWNAQIIENALKATLLPVVKRLVTSKDSIVYTGKWRGYDGLVFDGYSSARPCGG
ncbi:MAG: hypothetical protein COW61_04570, partial [Candidatus Yonathbacteria bacterium CG17_big_fil_post_rev_8_21_14_2_50_46_19]